LTRQEENMATTIQVSRNHTLGLEEAKERGHRLVARFGEKLSGFITDIEWSPDGTEGTASGKLFTAVFTITDHDISISVELRGLGARLMKSQLQASIERSLERRFS